MAALTALNWIILALTALNRKNGGVKRQITGKIAALTAFFVGINALTAFNGKNNGIKGV